MQVNKLPELFAGTDTSLSSSGLKIFFSYSSYLILKITPWGKVLLSSTLDN